MAASGKFTFQQIWFELPEAILEFAFADYSDSFHFDCGKSGSIRNPAAGFQFKKLRMAGGVASASQFLAGFARLYRKCWINGVEQRRFAGAGRADDGHDVALVHVQINAAQHLRGSKIFRLRT